jgi:hypothetical protein
MHFNRAVIDIALGIDVLVESLARQATAHHFHAADFNNAMIVRGTDTGGFGIEHDLSFLLYICHLI